MQKVGLILYLETLGKSSIQSYTTLFFEGKNDSVAKVWPFCKEGTKTGAAGQNSIVKYPMGRTYKKREAGVPKILH